MLEQCKYYRSSVCQTPDFSQAFLTSVINRKKRNMAKKICDTSQKIILHLKWKSWMITPSTMLTKPNYPDSAQRVKRPLFWPIETFEDFWRFFPIPSKNLQNNSPLLQKWHNVPQYVNKWLKMFLLIEWLKINWFCKYFFVFWSRERANIG